MGCLPREASTAAVLQLRKENSLERNAHDALGGTSQEADGKGLGAHSILLIAHIKKEWQPAL
jgi:hypothetical protein